MTTARQPELAASRSVSRIDQPNRRTGVSRHHLLDLQRAAGNHAIVQLLRPGALSLPGAHAGSLATAGNGPAAIEPCAPTVVQRQPATTQQVQEAIDKPDAATVADVGKEVLPSLPVTQRLAMINLLLGSRSFSGDQQIREIWDSFGRQIVDIATANADHWQRSWTLVPDQMHLSREVVGSKTYFLTDTEEIARGYLEENDQFCKDQMGKLGLTESGEVPIGPPTADQAAFLSSTQDDARKLAADQEAMRDLRNVPVGYEAIQVKPSPPGGSDFAPELMRGEVARFDPSGPPKLPPGTGDKMRSWDEVSKAHTDLGDVIRARVATNPLLFGLVKGGNEDATRAKEVGGGSRESALGQLGKSLAETRTNIGTTRGMLHTLRDELDPIHDKLLDGTVTSPATPARNWKTSTFYAQLAADIRRERTPHSWWVTMGLGAAQTAAYVIAGMATGGAAFAIGMAASGVANVILAEGKRQAITAAAGTNVSADTALITQGKVNEVAAEVIETAAFALLDVVVAASEVRGILREVHKYEEVAAKLAKQASEAADKALAAEGKAEGERLAKQARADAEEAKKAADDATKEAAKSTPEESARAGSTADKATAEAKSAEKSVQEAEQVVREGPQGEKIPPASVGEHTLHVIGNGVCRRSPGPCEQFLRSVTRRTKEFVTSLAASKVTQSVKDELKSRLDGLVHRATRINEMKLLELPPRERNLPRQRMLLETSALEGEMQSVERQIRLEGLAGTGEYGAPWGKFVNKTVEQRVATVEKASAEIAKQRKLAPNAELGNSLEKLRQRGKALAEQATAGTTKADDLAKEWRDLDTALEGVEREERQRRELAWELEAKGGRSLGESDTDMRKSLGTDKLTDPDLRGKSPDYGYRNGDSMMLADSKGGDISKALTQLRAGIASPGAHGVTKFDLRVYIKEGSFQKLIGEQGLDGFSLEGSRDGGFLMVNGQRHLVDGKYPVRAFRG